MRDHDPTAIRPSSASTPLKARVIVGLFSVFALSTGCALQGIEPDEIDIADAETGLTGSAGGDGDGDNADDGGETGNSTGDGDPTTTGDGDGDGDGDPTTTGTGDGDGDPTSGDGDGDGDPNATPCAELDPIPVFDGDNPIEVTNVANNFAGSCGGVDGPDAIFSYEATTAGQVEFSLDQPSFDGVVYLVGADCTPFVELTCDAMTVQADVVVGQTIHAIVDSNLAGVGGTATLTITGP